MDEMNVSSKNCKFAKHDKDHASHYSLLVQSFASEFTSSVHAKNSFEFVILTTCLVKQDEPSFAKKCFAKHYKTHTHCLWCVPISLFHSVFVMVCE